MNNFYSDLIRPSKSMLIAPAGYGKTHTIVECLKLTEGKSLILTHTHAGVAVLRDRFRKESINTKKYHIETISGYVLKYVNAFYIGTDIPEQSDDANSFFEKILEIGIDLLSRNSVKHIIGLSYTHLFVDEYQDCTIDQHKIITELSQVLKTHILGDPMQGIFDFKGGSLVDLEDTTQFEGFIENIFKLEEPYRWIKSGNQVLGENIKSIRSKLINVESIHLKDFEGIKLYISDNIYGDHWKTIMDIFKDNESVLVIDSDSKNVHSRIQFTQRFRGMCAIIEAIDDKDFYKLSKKVDDLGKISCSNETLIKQKTFEFLCESKLFSVTEVKKRINKKGLVNKKTEKDKGLSDDLSKFYNEFIEKNKFSLLADLLMKVSKIDGVKFYRKDLFYTLLNALKEADSIGIDVLEAMKNRRNTIRRVGRKIYGRSIGTTLLTKGLEFDTVIILNAHKFENKEHLYVALSRASKDLFIFSNSDTLTYS